MDACDVGLGTVLLQIQPTGDLHPVSYDYMHLKPHQRAYNTIEKVVESDKWFPALRLLPLQSSRSSGVLRPQPSQVSRQNYGRLISTFCAGSTTFSRTPWSFFISEGRTRT